jgi:hypothetical protein
MGGFVDMIDFRGIGMCEMSGSGRGRDERDDAGALRGAGRASDE